MAVPPQTRLTDEERLNLVAFLDGEVDESLARTLEEKVARSVSVRREIEALEKTWGMLDWLPRPELPADFASRTLTRIHSQQLRAELLEGRVKLGAKLVGKTLAAIAFFAAMVTVGFISLRHAWPDPTRELINNLDVIENLDTYRAIPDLKFLDDLSRLGIFVDSPAVPEPASEAESNPAQPSGA